MTAPRSTARGPGGPAHPPAAPPTLAFTGDPIHAGEVTSASALAQALGLALEAPGALALAPGAVLVHALVARPEPLALRWATLAGAPGLGPAREPAVAAVVLTGSLGRAADALRLVAALRARLQQPGVLARACAATTREALVSALDAAGDHAGEAALTGDEVMALVRTGPGGLSADEAVRRRLACGDNRLARVGARPLAFRLLEQLWSLFALLLWAGSALAFLAGMTELGWAILVVLLINGAFSFLQEYRAERAVEALARLLPPVVTVLRGGQEQRVPATELVPGDVVRLEEGDQVPADGQLLAAEGLQVDQSALTGESHPVFKTPTGPAGGEVVPRAARPELVFAGTGVVAGRATVVVTATGMATEIGHIAHLAQAVGEAPSPLQRELGRVTRVVTALALALGTSLFLLGLAAGVFAPTEGLFFALGIIVANVPEGLLPTLTLALALGVQRMARQRSLVKRLSAVETLGATTVICTDKTGTLTENRMTARLVWVSGRTVEVAQGQPDPEVRAVLEAAVLASRATRDHGDPTERALVEAAAAFGLDPEAARTARPLRASYPFDAYRKRMTLVREADGATVAYVKGAPSSLLALCEAVRWAGQTLPLTMALRRAVAAAHDRLAAEGYRLLAVAVRPLPAEAVGASVGRVEADLTLLGLVALWDPPRPEVAPAVALCRRAGIRVVMVTGDDGLTARAVARQIGLPVAKVVTGEELDRLRPEALRALLTEPGLLFARTSPAHKLAIVSALRALGEVVAVTGDGVNDAPALRAADIGVAMGGRGSEVAREAAEMVIADDHFASIVAAIRLGRAVYANIGKFVTYIFASNVPELVPFLAAVFFRIPLPLTLMQILAVDLGTDLLPALALGAEAPEPGVMDRPPRSRDERLLGLRRLLHAYGFLGLIEAALALLAFFWTYRVAGWRPGEPLAATGPLYRRATTMTLAGIVAAQIGNALACRTERVSVFRVGLTSNRLLLLGIVAEVGVLAGLILVPPLAAVFGLAPLRLAEWALLLPFPAVVLGLEEARKACLRRWEHGRGTRGPAQGRQP